MFPVAAVVVEYAKAFGVDFFHVYHTVPCAKLLLAVYCLRDSERIEQHLRRSDQLESAILSNYAFHAPKELSAAQARQRAALHRPALGGKRRESPAVVDAKRMIAEARSRRNET